MEKLIVMKNWFVKVFTFVFLLLNASLFSEDIRVALQTKKQLYPVYVSPVIVEESDGLKKYVSDLRDILCFDLDCSGYTEIVLSEKSKDILLSKSDFNISFDPDFWRTQKVRLALKLTATDKKLNVFIYDVSTEKYSYFSSISLSANLDEDRIKVHKLSDDILLSYFNKKGIAGTKIIYTVKAEEGEALSKRLSEVWMSDYDGGNKRRLTFDENYCVTPVFLSDNEEFPEFLYVSYKTGIPKIYFSGEKDPFISLRGNQLLPAVSPQKDKITFISDVAGRPDLFLQYLDLNKKPLGKPLQLFSSPRATQASSAFSPDGEKLAFVSDKDGSPRIYLLKIPERNAISGKRPHVQLLTMKNRYNVTPAWSFDGTKLAYSSKVNGVRQIWVYDFVTGEETQLTTGGQNKENPCWAEDNLHILYNTDEKYLSDLYIINLNSPKPVKITSGFGQKRFPAWGR